MEQMLRVFPGADLLTSVLDAAAMPPAFRRAVPSMLQRIPSATRHHEWLLPLMPLAWRTRPAIRRADVVLSSSHSCAKAVRVAPGIPHVCYCHTPMRYAWDFAGERHRFPAAVRPLAQAVMRGFRAWDRATAERVTRFVANSTAVADRIERFYGRTAEVIHPPVETDFFTPGPGGRQHFLYVGRLVSYKRSDLVVEAFAGLPYDLVVVGQGHLGRRLRERATPNVRFVDSVTGEELRDLYRNAIALVYPAVEDFGIAMAEAQSCGTPVIGLREGGALDIVDDGRTGWLLDRADLATLRRAVHRASADGLDREAISRRAERFSSERYRAEIRETVIRTVEGAAARTRAPEGTLGRAG